MNLNQIVKGTKVEIDFLIGIGMFNFTTKS